MNPFRHAIRSQVQTLMRSSDARDSAPLVRPDGDDGLFGPGSAVWTVHADFTAMMIGGVSSLMMQMLHPAALAGVWDHSNFRADMRGRLQRTARFVGVTTRGSTEAAEAAIARVRSIHDRVTGTLPDGTPYSANDPALLTWVHVAEAYSFLAGYLRYREPGFSAARQDAYFAEMAMLAERLGATDVPATRRDVAAYLRAMRSELRSDERTRDVARTLLEQPASSIAAKPLQRVLLDAGVELLPDWAVAMHGLRMPLGRRLAVRAGGAGAGRVLRWALN